IKKSTGSTGTIYGYADGSDPLIETDLAGNLQNEYIFFNGKRLAWRDAVHSKTHYYYSDHLGSSDIIASSTGTIEDESDYYPFGGERHITNLASQNYKFTGKERDSESNLDNFGARYYGSNLGRFMTPDWAAKAIAVPYATFGNPQSLNLF